MSVVMQHDFECFVVVVKMEEDRLSLFWVDEWVLVVIFDVLVEKEKRPFWRVISIGLARERERE